jgi:predicted kinase
MESKLMSRVLHILCGIPASGKSSWAKRMYRRLDAIWISTDEFRWMLYNSQFDASREPELWSQIEITARVLLARHNIILDACNLTISHRAWLIRAANEHNARATCHIFQTSLEDCLHRNAMRTHPVPVKTLHSMSKIYHAPSLTEGIHDIVIHKQRQK